MSVKKPTLAGVKYRTRKRNIVHQDNPTGFKDVLQDILKKSLDPLEVFPMVDKSDDDLNFFRYSDYFWDVLLGGGTGACVGRFDADATPFSPSFFALQVENPPNIRDIHSQLVEIIQQFLRRKPFLGTSLRHTVHMLLNSYDLFKPAYQEALTTALARLLGMKILRSDILITLTKNDAIVGSQQALSVVTIIIHKLDKEAGMDPPQIIRLFNESGMLDRLSHFFPSTKRTAEFYSEHWVKEGMEWLWTTLRSREVRERKSEMVNMIRSSIRRRNEEIEERLSAEEDDDEDEDDLTEEQLAELEAAREKARLEEEKLEKDTFAEIIADIDQSADESKFDIQTVLISIWDGMMSSVDWSARAAQREGQALKQIQRWGVIMTPFADRDDTGKAQLGLMNKIQVFCHEHTFFTRMFVSVIHELYQKDVIEEDVIREWYKKGASLKNRELFKKQIEPLIEWLDKAPIDPDALKPPPSSSP